MSHFYQHSEDNLFHVSVGAVLFNNHFEVCSHHFRADDIPEDKRYHLGGLSHCYHLMRESIENEESLMTAVHRGLQEEFGAHGVIERYLGALIARVETPRWGTFEKTTLYHAVRLTSLGKRPDVDAESHSVMEWHEPHALLALYEEQASKTDREELHEAGVIRRFIHAYEL